MINSHFLKDIGKQRFSTVLADPPWRFQNRTGKVAPEYKKYSRYETLSLEEIKNMPISSITEERAHLYLWVPNALLQEGLDTMKAWGFEYKSMITWVKITKKGDVHKGGVGFYFRNATEQLLFGVKGKNVRTLKAGRTQPNVIISERTRHSAKPEEQYNIIENCSWDSYLELFARQKRQGWISWGNEI